MQRFVSITTIAALIATLVSPGLSKSHAGTGTRMVCHRATVVHVQMATRVHHCAEMETMSDAQPEDAPPQTSFRASNQAGNCPMDCCCCIQANPGKNATLVSQQASLAAVVEQDRVSVRSIVFRSRGFSSHTDRGPPSSRS